MTRRFPQKRSAGTGMAEYAMILSLVGLSSVAALTLMGDSIGGALEDVGGKLFAAITGTGRSGGATLASAKTAETAGTTGMALPSETPIYDTVKAMMVPSVTEPEVPETAMKMASVEAAYADDDLMGGDPVMMAKMAMDKEEVSECTDDFAAMKVADDTGAMQVYNNTIELSAAMAQTLETLAYTATDDAGNPVDSKLSAIIAELAQRGYKLASAQEKAYDSETNTLKTVATGGVFAGLDSFYNYYMKEVAPVIDQPQYSQLKAQLEQYSGTISKIAEVHYVAANSTNNLFYDQLNKDYTIGGVTSVDVTLANAAPETQANSAKIEETQP